MKRKLRTPNAKGKIPAMDFAKPIPTLPTQVLTDDIKLDEAPYRRCNHPLTRISKPHNNDVLFGRGGRAYHHEGNKAFRGMVAEYKPEYERTAKRTDKAVIALNIVKRLRYEQTPPGRFLSYDTKSKSWFDVGDRKARSKTSQALRERPTVVSNSPKKDQSPPSLTEEASYEKVALPERKRRRLVGGTGEQSAAVIKVETEIEDRQDVLNTYEPHPLEDSSITPPESVAFDPYDMEVVSLLASECDADADDFSLSEVDFPEEHELLWEGDIGLGKENFVFIGDRVELRGEDVGRPHTTVSFDGLDNDTLVLLDDIKDAGTLPFATLSLSTIDFDNIFDERRLMQEMKNQRVEHTVSPDKSSACYSMATSSPIQSKSLFNIGTNDAHSSVLGGAA